MSTPPPNPWLYDRFALLLTAAVDDNAELVADVLQESGAREGAPGIFAICYTLAHTIALLAFPNVKIGDGTLSGDIVIAEALPHVTGDPAALWAVRFVAAYINGDRPRCRDMFFTLLANDDKRLLSGVMELLHMAADLARLKETELS